MRKNVLAFAREAGGVAAIAPVCRAMLSEGWNLLLLSKDHGLTAFMDRGIECVPFPLFDTTVLDALVQGRFGDVPDLVFTSATSLPTLDMTERYLWQWGKAAGVPTVGVLDQWQNYALRFSGPSPEERLAYLPDHIFVMDDYAQEAMTRIGILKERISITGQPAFDNLAERFSELASRKVEKRRLLDIPETCTVVTFVAESLQKDFGPCLGYDEQTTVAFLGAVLKKISSENEGVQPYLLIKPHPENMPEEFRWTLSKWPSLKKRLLGPEANSLEILAISDIVVGMISTMLVEAALCGIPVISLQLDATDNSQFMLTERNIIPFNSTKEAGADLIKGLLVDPGYRAEYLQRQSGIHIAGDAVSKTMETICKILQHKEVADEHCR
ncbi:MAG: hypothetical protein HQL08_01040 [Nitrospirae bacterium]|nr:hypothetical protein [Nitrospirota bacterium]